MTVGLRCGKANTKTPRSFARLGSVFVRDSSGRSVLYFPMKEDSTRLATSFPFSKRPNGKKPPRVKPLFPPARVPPQETPTGSTGPSSSFSTLTRVLQATSAFSGTGRISGTAQRVSGGAMASSLTSWTPFPEFVRKNRASRQAATAQSPCPFGRR